MNTEFFIAKKLHRGKNEGKKVSQPIVKISTVSIILAMAVNIVTIAVVTGFQNQVRDKVVGFGSHAQIIKSGEFSTFESDPILKNQVFLTGVSALKEVKSVNAFGYQAALLQSKPDSVWYTINAKDTFQIEQEIQGVVLKGVDSSFDWSFFESKLLEGRIPDFTSNTASNEILISKKIANNLHFSLNEKARAFFVKDKPIKKIFTVVGIFESGLEDLDEQIIFGDLRQVQKLNEWGIQASIRVADTIVNKDQLLIYADVTGGNKNYRYDWGQDFETNYGFTYCDVKDTTIRLVVSDYWMNLNDIEAAVIPDTAYLKITVNGNKNLPCIPKNIEDGVIQKKYLNDSGTQFQIEFEGGKSMTFELIDGKGSYNNYVGGFEISVNEWQDLDKIVKKVKKEVYKVVDGNETALEKFKVKSIKQDQEEIFLWLDFLDLNVLIILVLMVLIGIINMGSGLLVLIITKTNFIGLMKALGSSNWQIRKVFLYQASFLLVRGMFFGNLLGIGICLAQQYFNIIPLNPSIYYLSSVPVELNIWHVLALNAGTLLVCVLALIIPSYAITKISPVRAMRKN